MRLYLCKTRSDPKYLLDSLIYLAGSRAPYIHVILSYVVSITWYIIQPLVRLLLCITNPQLVWYHLHRFELRNDMLQFLIGMFGLLSEYISPYSISTIWWLHRYSTLMPLIITNENHSNLCPTSLQWQPALQAKTSSRHSTDLNSHSLAMPAKFLHHPLSPALWLLLLSPLSIFQCLLYPHSCRILCSLSKYSQSQLALVCTHHLIQTWILVQDGQVQDSQVNSGWTDHPDQWPQLPSSGLPPRLHGHLIWTPMVNNLDLSS